MSMMDNWHMFDCISVMHDKDEGLRRDGQSIIRLESHDRRVEYEAAKHRFGWAIE